MSFLLGLACAGGQWLLLWTACALLGRLRALVVRRRIQSVHWIDDYCLLTSRSLVAPSGTLRSLVEQLVWYERGAALPAVAVVNGSAMRAEMHNMYDDEEKAHKSFKQTASTTLLVYQVVGAGWCWWTALLVSAWCLGCLLAQLACNSLRISEMKPLELGMCLRPLLNMPDERMVRQILDLDLGATHALIRQGNRQPPLARLPARPPARPVVCSSTPPARTPTEPPPAPPVGDAPACVVCMENARTHAGSRCGHLCLCGPCVAQVGGRCPVCRAASAFVRIYEP